MKTKVNTDRSSGPVWVRIAALAGIVVAVFLALKFSGLSLSDFTPDKIKRFILSYGAWGPFIYIIVYALRSVALVVPAGILSFAGGLAFGKALGFACIVMGSEAGACLAFGVCRFFGRSVFERFPWFHKGKIHDLDLSAETNGFKIILYVRLMLIFPFDPINIAAGLSRIRFRDFALASFIGLIPASYIEAVLGSSLGNFRSPEFVLAAIAWVLMMSIPLLVKKWRPMRKGSKSRISRKMNCPVTSGGVSQSTETSGAASGGELNLSPASGDPSAPSETRGVKLTDSNESPADF